MAAQSPLAPHFPRTSLQTIETLTGLKCSTASAGPSDAPIILLLHGFPTSFHI